jgi:hypothetical protein
MDEVPSDEEQRVAGLDDLEARVERLERAVVDLRNAQRRPGYWPVRRIVMCRSSVMSSRRTRGA